MRIDYPAELQKRFERSISEGGYAPGELATVQDLARRFEAPIEPMRQVLQAAYRKGLVDRVGPEGDEIRILGLAETHLESVFTHTARAGFRPTSLVRDVEVEPASPEVASKLDVPVGSPAYRYVRTRYVEGRPLANQTNHIPYEVCPGLEHDDVSRYSFQKLLEEKYLAVQAEMKERFALVAATGQDREILDLPENSSVLLIERTALGPTGRPLVWANIRIRTDRYEYVEALWPQAAELLKPDTKR